MTNHEHLLDDLSKPEKDERALRKKALRRSWIYPGGGYALLGRGELAVATFFASAFMFVFVAWFLIQPGPAVVWTALGWFVIAAILWISEQVAVTRLSFRAPEPRFLVDGFVVVSGVAWLAAGVAGDLVTVGEEVAAETRTLTRYVTTLS